MSDEIKIGLLDDKEKTNLNKNDFFDKVINLKLVAGKYTDQGLVGQDEYVIRSDYELYFPSLMKSVSESNTASFLTREKCVIRKCQYKPSIKVQYKRVSLSSGIEVDIYIHNFHMLDKDGKTLMHFNNVTYPLVRVELAMGYFGQFNDLFGEKVPQSFKQFFNFGFTKEDTTENPDATNHGITVITVSNVNYTQLDKLPPDSVLHIHGYVGNILSPKFDFSEKEVETDYKTYIESPYYLDYEKAKGKNLLEKTYYKYITKEWVKKSALSKALVKSLASESGASKETLSDSNADKYGIQVYLSAGAVKWAEDKEKIYPKDSTGQIVYPSLTIGKANTAEAKMNIISNALGLEGFTHLLIDSTGDYFLCRNEEVADIKTMLENTKIAKLYEKTSLATYWKNKIPAVYNITVDALCTIVCPFFCFINPFEKVNFKTRYSLGGVVKYFSDINQSAEDFYVLWENVSFATVENINECTLVCTGVRGDSNGTE